MKPKTTFFFLILIANLFHTCNSSGIKNNSIEGVWKSIGYGKILKVDSTTYSYFDITDVSCLPSKQGDILSVANSMELTNDTLVVKRGYSVYYYTRTEELPKLCQKNSQNVNDPLYNFEVFANN